MKTSRALLLLTILCLVSPLLFQNIFASSSFARQEILDNKRDWRDEQSNLIENGDQFTDLVTITYLSDGKNFNATFWLAGVFLEKPPRDLVSYGMLIDADANSKTGLFGFDYATEIIWDGQSWTKKFEERTRFNNVRILSMEKNFTSFFDKIGKTVRLSFDLDSMGSPEEYSVAFYTMEKKEIDDSVITLYDFSALVNIPPPEFLISTLPESIILKQGEEKIIQVEVKSTTGFQPKVELSITPIDKISLKLTSNELVIPPFGIAATPLEITASEDAPPRPYMLVIKANATFPLDQLIREDELDKTRILQLEENFVVEKTAPVTILVEQFSMEEYFLEEMEKWQVLLYTLATLGTGGVLFAFKDRISEIYRKRKEKQKTSETDSTI